MYFCHDNKLHNFPYPGSDCNNCGVNQHTLGKKPKKIKEHTIREQKKGAYTEIQALAIEIWEYFGKDKGTSVGQIIGVLKRKGLQWGYQVMATAKQEGGISIELFMFKSKNKKDEDIK